MRSIAVFLILNILLLSSMTGMANIHHVKADCCVAKMHKDCCRHQKQETKDDCAKGNCNAMLSCGTCGFILTTPISYLPAVIDLYQQAAYPFKAGALSDYHDNGWNPPKV
ncbi:hypothetical protein [Mucilaginibacter gilvus]|uniref:Uncharacterized protein n=1 Tax=Mucilaginibacter gilvus TaxID=2305909 RepID=A0A444MJF4_9SPHI|nr:hypothetical protein [Mucilaginibacter gilvus]RWY48364.1 hypothetical protein EPL05_19670 [Mucilaginibacter gilvus]